MRVLITGALGFVGRHLAAELQASGHTTVLLDKLEPPKSGFVSDLPYYQSDLADAELLLKILKEVRPEACVHLGGIAFVPLSWTDPAQVMQVNLVGTINLLEALRKAAPETRFLLASSAEVYGRVPAEAPLTEDARPLPENPYALSKFAAEEMVRLYSQAYGLWGVAARPCNHIGPGQSPSFVVASFARQLHAMVSGKEAKLMRVGNLDSKRSFLDVRDVVRAYRLLIEQPQAEPLYNVALEADVSIREILNSLIAEAGIEPDIETDPKLYRPTDSLPLLDVRRLREKTGWSPKFSLQATLRDIWNSFP